MNERIKLLRKSLGLTQDDFASKVGLSRNFIAQIEIGTKQPSDRTISDICRVFAINEQWLRSGEGHMHLNLTKNQEIAQFLNDVMEQDDADFKKKFINVLAKLDEKEWALIAKMMDSTIKNELE